MALSDVLNNIINGSQANTQIGTDSAAAGANTGVGGESAVISGGPSRSTSTSTGSAAAPARAESLVGGGEGSSVGGTSQTSAGDSARPASLTNTARNERSYTGLNNRDINDPEYRQALNDSLFAGTNQENNVNNNAVGEASYSEMQTSTHPTAQAPTLQEAFELADQSVEALGGILPPVTPQQTPAATPQQTPAATPQQTPAATPQQTPAATPQVTPPVIRFANRAQREDEELTRRIAEEIEAQEREQELRDRYGTNEIARRVQTVNDIVGTILGAPVFCNGRLFIQFLMEQGILPDGLIGELQTRQVDRPSEDWFDRNRYTENVIDFRPIHTDSSTDLDTRSYEWGIDLGDQENSRINIQLRNFRNENNAAQFIPGNEALIRYCLELYIQELQQTDPTADIGITLYTAFTNWVTLHNIQYQQYQDELEQFYDDNVNERRFYQQGYREQVQNNPDANRTLNQDAHTNEDSAIAGIIDFLYGTNLYQTLLSLFPELQVTDEEKAKVEQHLKNFRRQYEQILERANNNQNNDQNNNRSGRRRQRRQARRQVHRTQREVDRAVNRERKKVMRSRTFASANTREALEALNREIFKAAVLLGFDVDYEKETVKEADRKLIIQFFFMYRGISPDYDGNIIGNDGKALNFRISFFANTVSEWQRKILKNENPFEFTRTEASTFSFGSKRIPIFLPTLDMCRKLLSASRAFRQQFGTGARGAIRLQRYYLEIFRQHVLPVIRNNSTVSPQQKKVLLSMARAEAQQAEQSQNSAIREEDLNLRTEFSISDDLNNLHRTVGRQNNSRLHGSCEQVEAYVNELDRRNAHYKASIEAAQSNTTVRYDENGNAIATPKRAGNTFAYIVHTIATIGRLFNIALRPQLAIGGVIEKAAGEVVVSGSSRILGLSMRAQARSQGRNINTSPTPEMMEYASSEVCTNALQCYNLLYYADGDVAVAGFIDSGRPLTQDNVQAWIAETYGDNSIESSKVAKVLNKIERTTSSLTSATLSADWLFRSQDVRTFFEYLCLACMQNRENGSPGLQATPEMLAEALVADPNEFWRDILNTPEGSFAFKMMTQKTSGAVNPISMWIIRFTRNHPILDGAYSVFVDRFARYGVNMIGNLLPFSHTAMFVGTDLYYQAKVAFMQRAGRPVTEATIEGSRYQVGAENLFSLDEQGRLTREANEFGEGLRLALIMDLAWIGERSVFFLIGVATIIALGIEPPDDDELILNPYEWKIGGVAVELPWWSKDIFGLVGPAAIATAAVITGKTSAHNAWQMTLNGLMDAADGTAVLDTFELITTFNKNLQMQEAQLADKYDMSNISDLEFFMTSAITFGYRKLYETFEPAIIRDLWGSHGLFTADDLAHSKSTRYTLDPTDDPDATEQVSYEEYMLRKITYNSPGLAFFADLVSGYYLNNSGVQRTSYSRSGMPLAVEQDALGLEWENWLALEPDADDVTKQMQVDKVTNLLTAYSAEDLAANGVVIPYNVRVACYDYYTLQQRAAYEDYYNRIAEGEFSTSVTGLSYEECQRLRNAAYTELQYIIDVWDGYKDALYSDALPYSAAEYYRWETDYRPTFYWADNDGNRTGELATALDYVLPWNQSNIQVEYKASGTHKSGFLPLSTVDNRYGTNNAETPVAWNTEGRTSLDILNNLYSGKTFSEDSPIPESLQGADIMSVLTNEGQSETPLYGQRAHMATTESYALKDQFKEVADEIQSSYNDDVSDLKSKSSSSSSKSSSKYSSGGRSYSRSSRGYSRSGGSSSYTAKIYSNPANNINGDKAATMYSKTPYGITFDYLRPDFETKGSREAYKRSDI